MRCAFKGICPARRVAPGGWYGMSAHRKEGGMGMGGDVHQGGQRAPDLAECARIIADTAVAPDPAGEATIQKLQFEFSHRPGR